MTATRAGISASFRDSGLRCTSQRYAILQCLLKRPCHPTAEEIHDVVNRNHPRASRATIYNSLHVLVESGLVREVKLGGDATRFEAHIESHHHFVCDNCGVIEDIEWFEPGEVTRRAGLARRSIRAIVLQGLCEPCLAQKKSF